ncbi:hypothetical protein TL16_g12147 [Triparma laevis f. inornata]|uniref:Uncharacterized protein n=1 Tax=Triparma laevis f. inornata TaxID=1714386 RepID=A0A9W7EV51_9STRA|nr:hypothetical protein TL16_g12147 [Triparma laevis f. inornata]
MDNDSKYKPSMRNRVASLPAILPKNDGIPKRRRTSIFDLLVSQPDTTELSQTTSFRQDYRALKTTEERIEKAVQVFRKDVLEPFLEDPEAENIFQEFDSFVSAQVAKGLTPAEADKLKGALVNAMAVDIKEVDHFKPLWVVLLGLVGMKPALESFRDATRATPFPTQKMSNDQMLFTSRITEVITEAIPQAVVQTLVLLQYPDQRTSLQFVSLFTSFLTTGFVVASADKEFDTSKHRRKQDPLLFGYVPKDSAHRQMVASVSFFTLYMFVKVFSLCLLIASSSFRYAVGLLTLEYFAILAWRKSYGNWRFFQRGVDGVGFSLFSHFCWYISLLAAPFPLTRTPTTLTPRVYSGRLAYMLGINFVIPLFSYRVFEGIDYITESQAWVFLATTTLVCLVSGFVAFQYVPDSHKPTFYKRWTFKEHMTTYWWNDCFYDHDHHHQITTDQE